MGRTWYSSYNESWIGGLDSRTSMDIETQVYNQICAQLPLSGPQKIVAIIDS